jgi:hypothetical protein
MSSGHQCYPISVYSKTGPTGFALLTKHQQRGHFYIGFVQRLGQLIPNQPTGVRVLYPVPTFPRQANARSAFTSAFLGELADVVAPVRPKIAQLLTRDQRRRFERARNRFELRSTVRVPQLIASIPVHCDADRLWLGLGFCGDRVYFFLAHDASISRKGLKQIAIELFLRENR